MEAFIDVTLSIEPAGPFQHFPEPKRIPMFEPARAKKSSEMINRPHQG
jgi:hypothetical protein